MDGVMKRAIRRAAAGGGAAALAQQPGLDPVENAGQCCPMPVGVPRADIDAEAEALSHGTVSPAECDRNGRPAAARWPDWPLGRRSGRMDDRPIPGTSAPGVIFPIPTIPAII